MKIEAGPALLETAGPLVNPTQMEPTMTTHTSRPPQPRTDKRDFLALDAAAVALTEARRLLDAARARRARKGGVR